MRLVRALTVVMVAVATSAPGDALAAAGDLDPTFGDGGIATVTFPVGAFATAVAIQADGKIVAVGSAAGPSGTGEFAVTRLLPDGSLDPTFGDGGLITTAIRGGHGDEARSVAVTANGRIVVAGTDSWERFAVVRYLTDGTPDPAFGRSGIVRTNFQPSFDVAWDVALQPDGRIVAVGGAGLGQLGFEIARYRRDGSLDPTFGQGGRLTLRYRGANARSVAIQPDGRIVVAGYNAWGLAVARLLPDGTPDRSFADRGRLEPPTPSIFALAVDVQPNGRILLAGDHDIFRVGLARLLPDGRFDRTFGDQGVVVSDIGADEQAWSGLALDGDGRIVALGHTVPHEGGTPADLRAVVGRFRRDGTPDETFGASGLVTTALPEGLLAEGLARQADGMLVVAGGLGPADAMVLLRYVA